MKKKLGITAAILLLLFVSFWGYIQYKKRASYETLIPQNTAMLVRIDVYDLYRSLLMDYGKIKKKKKKSFFEGLAIPANIFLFTLKDKQTTTLFSSLTIEDHKAFEESLRQHKTLIPSATDQPGIKMMGNTDKTWTLAYNNTDVVFAYSLVKEDVRETLQDLLQKKNTTTVAQSKLKNIKNQDGHITFTDGVNTGSLNFNKGRIEGSANLIFNNWNIPAKVQRRKTREGSALQVWCYIDPTPLLLHKTFRIDTVTLYGDSLLAYNLKGLDLELGKPVIQKDTVVTYEYNDDFEKVPVATVKENSVPGLNLWLQADVNPLYAYMRRQHLLEQDSGSLSSAIFPLYRLYVYDQRASLLVTAIKNQEPSEIHKETSQSFFGLYADFEQLKQQPGFSLLEKYTTPFKSIQIKATRSSKEKVGVNAVLEMKSTNNNALLSLLQLF